jgi:hypothetical protein
MQNDRQLKVVPLSRSESSGSIRCTRLKIRGEVTFTKHSRLLQMRKQPLLALCDERELPPRLMNRLKRLDDEQLQIVELVAAAMERGVL